MLLEMTKSRWFWCDFTLS